MQPPLLPDETLSRVYRLARRDGTLVLAIAGFFALLSAAAGDHIGVTVGLLVAGAGAIELHGSHLLRLGETRAMRWLIGSQFFLMAAVIAYCAVRLATYDPRFINQALTPELRQSFAQAGYTGGALNELVERVYHLTYGAVALVTLLYQGGMALHYARRRESVALAIADAEREL